MFPGLPCTSHGGGAAGEGRRRSSPPGWDPIQGIPREKVGKTPTWSVPDSDTSGSLASLSHHKTLVRWSFDRVRWTQG